MVGNFANAPVHIKTKDKFVIRKRRVWVLDYASIIRRRYQLTVKPLISDRHKALRLEILEPRSWASCRRGITGSSANKP